jgi:hypothetical protein
VQFVLAGLAFDHVVAVRPDEVIVSSGSHDVGRVSATYPGSRADDQADEKKEFHRASKIRGVTNQISAIHRAVYAVHTKAQKT